MSINVLSWKWNLRFNQLIACTFFISYEIRSKLLWQLIQNQIRMQHIKGITWGVNMQGRFKVIKLGWQFLSGNAWFKGHASKQCYSFCAAENYWGRLKTRKSWNKIWKHWSDDVKNTIGDGGSTALLLLKLLTLLTLLTMFDTVDMTYNESSFHTHLSCSNFPIGKTSWGVKCPLESDCHTDVSEYFQIDCSRGCPRVFSNSLWQAVVQEYFRIHSRTRLSRTIF